MELKIGDYNTLRVIKEVDFGLYLDGGDDLEILIPKVYVPEGTEVDDDLDVFIYKDSEDRLIATTQKPYGKVDEIVALEVVDTNDYGVFMDWGLMKHLFVPFSHQGKKMQKGYHYVVKILLDRASDRLIGSAIENHIIPGHEGLTEGQNVSLIIYDKTELGYKALINNRHTGLLFANEVFKQLKAGDKLEGIIKKLREDGKIDLSIRQKGYSEVKSETQTILDLLKSSKGFLPYHDKTDAETIYDVFQMSKKTFKAAIGTLYKNKQIVITPKGIQLV